jgi:hypothetical protein
MYRGRRNVVSPRLRALARPDSSIPKIVRTVAAPLRRRRESARAVGKTLERMFANQEQYAGEFVTIFNESARMMAVNQADSDRDQEADPTVGTRLEDGNVSWQPGTKHQASARPSLNSGSP